MKLLLILCLALNVWTPPPWPRPVHLVYVNTSATTWMQETMDAARLDVQAGLNFWNILPDSARVTWNIVSSEVITPSATTAGSWDYTEPWRKTWVDATIFLVPGSGRGVAYPAQRIMIIPMTPFDDATLLRPTVAHEWGHLGYGLPDLYNDDPCAPDVMCEPREAYIRGFVGCVSLEALGLPCHKVYAPLVQRQPR